MGKKEKLHDAGGKKIMHPADAVRRQAKKRKLEKTKQERADNFERKMLGTSPEEVEHEIRALKFDHERKRAAKIEVTKHAQDRLTRLEANYKRLKETIQEKHEKRQAEPKSSLHVNFEELKIHRKSSIFYHPINNPYGAPPNGQTLMYRHPDGSVKREPPPLAQDAAPAAPGFDGPNPDSGSGESEDGASDKGEAKEEDDDDDDDDDMEPMLPSSLPGGMQIGSASSSTGRPLPPGMPPLAPWAFPGLGMPLLPAGMPPLPCGMLPLGMPPLLGGMPPLPPGMPPLPAGMPPLPGGMPPLPAGMPPLPAGMPPMQGLLGKAGGAAPASQDAFLAELQQAGFQLPPGCSPPGVLAGLVPPGPPPKPKAPDAKGKGKGKGKFEGGKGKDKGGGKGKDKGDGKGEKGEKGGEAAAPQPQTLADLPPGTKAPPPPPKTVGAKPTGAAGARTAALSFVPSVVRTKKASQVAGGVLQVSSASLSQEKRQRTLFQEVPKVAQKLDMDDAFAAFLEEVDEAL